MLTKPPLQIFRLALTQDCLPILFNTSNKILILPSPSYEQCFRRLIGRGAFVTSQHDSILDAKGKLQFAKGDPLHPGGMNRGSETKIYIQFMTFHLALAFSRASSTTDTSSLS